MRSSMPGMPLGICVNASFPSSFWVVSKGQWSVPTVSIRPAAKRIPEDFLIAFVAQGRRHHMLHAFDAGPLRVSLVEHEDAVLRIRSKASSRVVWLVSPFAARARRTGGLRSRPRRWFRGTWRTGGCPRLRRLRGGWARATRDRFCLPRSAPAAVAPTSSAFSQ